MASRFRFQSNQSQGNQATLGLLIAMAIGFVLCWIPELGKIIIPNLGFSFSLQKFWTFFTYPFTNAGDGSQLFFFILGLLWFYSFGGMLESRIGKSSMVIHFFLAAFLHSLFAFIASTFVASPTLIVGGWLPVSFITVIVCALSPEASMSFWMVPVKMKWMALITALLTIFSYGTGSPLFGIITAIPLLGAWFYGVGKLGSLRVGENPLEKRVTKVRANKEFDEFRSKVLDKEKERAEKERLRKLLEGSLDDQDPPQAKK